MSNLPYQTSLVGMKEYVHTCMYLTIGRADEDVAHAVKTPQLPHIFFFCKHRATQTPRIAIYLYASWII